MTHFDLFLDRTYAISNESLESIDLRDIWPDEAKDFTPWLAQSENLVLLADALNMALRLEEQEVDVGQFRADLLCRNPQNNAFVLIENQLEVTDHTHLGQILTYAAGLEATTFVWISTGFTEEHRAALNWLNVITPERLQFFGVIVEGWRCENAELMVHFSVYAACEGWSGQKSSARPIAAPRQQQERFWSAFREYLVDKQSSMAPNKMKANSYLTFRLGRRGFKLSTMLSKKNQYIGVRLYISGQDAQKHYSQLVEQRETIEQEFGESLEWSEAFGRNPCRVTLRKADTDPTDEADWQNQFEWLRSNLEKLDKIFRPRIAELLSSNFCFRKIHGRTCRPAFHLYPTLEISQT